MGTLTGSLYVGLASLRSQQFALNVAGNNVANVNTPGYSRQRAILEPTEPLRLAAGFLGTGVEVNNIRAARDRFLELRLNQENQRQGAWNSQTATLTQVESILGQTGDSGISSTVSRFFNSFSALAGNPTSTSLRQQVLSAANDLASVMRNAYSRLDQIQRLNDQDVAGNINQVNSLTSRIAQLNAQISGAEGLGKDSLSLRDQRQVLLNQLAERINVDYFETESGAVTVSTGNGRSLVTGDTASTLTVGRVGSSPFYSVLSGSTDITSEISGGKIGGLLRTRDTLIPGYLQSLDTLANTIITRVNTQHAAGSDLTGAAGGNFFAPVAGVAGSARNMAVAITDPARIAAAAAGGPAGNNANALAIADLQNQRLVGPGATFVEFYSALVSRAGSDSKAALDNLTTQRGIVRQLQNQRESISGVSLDEEMVNILQFQKAYDAAARYVSIINSLTEDTMRMIGR